MESVARVIDLNVARNIEITENKHEHLETKLDRFVTNIVSEEEYNEGNHFADSLESIDDINNMILALSKRDYSSMVLFIVGINTGYRPVDLLAWRWKHIVENGKFLRTFAMPEHKTGKTALVNLNETTIKILTWFMEYKMCNEIDFSMENFVFSSMKNKGQKTFLYLEKETNKMWHTNKANAEKGLMYSFENRKKIFREESTIVNDTEHYIKLRKPIDTDTISKHLIKCAETVGISGHFTSYTTRHTHSYWFATVAMDDPKFADIAKREMVTRLLSTHFNHSSTKITTDYYMRFESKAISGIVFELNLGKEAVDMIVNNYNEVKNDCGEQVCWL